MKGPVALLLVWYGLCAYTMHRHSLSRDLANRRRFVASPSKPYLREMVILSSKSVERYDLRRKCAWLYVAVHCPASTRFMVCNEN